MRLLIEGKFVKIQNFVEYLLENFNEKGKTYEFELHIDDRYDKKALENRQHSLQGNLLVMHADGFEILGTEYMNDLEKFKEEITKLTDKEEIVTNFTDDNFQNLFIRFKLSFIENEQKHNFEFSFINITE